MKWTQEIIDIYKAYSKADRRAFEELDKIRADGNVLENGRIPQDANRYMLDHWQARTDHLFSRLPAMTNDEVYTLDYHVGRGEDHILLREEATDETVNNS